MQLAGRAGNVASGTQGSGCLQHLRGVLTAQLTCRVRACAQGRHMLGEAGAEAVQSRGAAPVRLLPGH